MTQTTVSLAKTSQPVLSRVLNRERLFNKIDNADEINRGIWIAGPPGSGKTTLIASYLATHNLESLWYQLDSSDVDIATFFYYFRRSVIKRNPNAGFKIPELQDNTDNLLDFGRKFFRAIFLLYNKPLFIVFDNYETIPVTSEIHDILSLAMEEISLHSKLVIVSRTDVSPPFSRHFINNFLIVINGNDLKLNQDELIKLSLIRSAETTDKIVKDIHLIGDGWIAGSILLLEYSKINHGFGQFNNVKSNSLLFDYIAQEIFSNFDIATQDFLLNVCWPKTLSVKLAKELSNEPTAHQILSNLSKNNYFVTERDEGETYEYILHPLLRDFLQSKTYKSNNESDINELKKYTSKLLVENNNIEDAVELIITIHDWDYLVSLILKFATDLIKEGRTAMLVKWIQELPQDKLDKNGHLLFWMAKARQQHSPREARFYFESAFNNFNKSDSDVNYKVAACCGVINSIILDADDYHFLDSWLQTLLKFLSTSKELISPEELINIEITILLALVLRNPGHNDLSDWFDRVELEISKMPNNELSGEYKLWLILAKILNGQFDQSKSLLLSIHNIIKNSDYVSLKCKYYVLSSLNYILLGDNEAVENSTEKCLTIINNHSLHNFMPYVFACQCANAILQNNIELSDILLEKLNSKLSDYNRLQRFLYHYLSSWKALVCKDNIRSHHDQRQAQSYASELGIIFLELLSSITYAQILFNCNDKNSGTAQLRRAHSVIQDLKNPYLEFIILLIYGEIEIKEGNYLNGINALRYALGLGRKHGFYRIPWWEPDQLSNICAVSLKNKIEIDYVRDFVKRSKLKPPPSSIYILEWPRPLLIKTLGKFSISFTDKNINSKYKFQGKPFQLLKILISMGGRDIPVDNISKVLWPHVDNDYANKSFTINLHRLRNILNNENAILLRNGCLSINDEFVWLDIWALECIESELNSISLKPETDIIEYEQLGERLLSTYKDPFLVNENDIESIFAMRERCQKLLLNSLNILVENIDRNSNLNREIMSYKSKLPNDSHI